jgi:ribosomal protein S18 acetylase RimI-like enzyme
VIFEDWRDVPAGDLAALYAVEGARWLSALGWDQEPSWRIVEDARLAGRLPGLVARHRNLRPAGWAFYLLHDGILQIGGLVGETAGTVRALLERVLQSPEARFARGFSCFLFPASPSLQVALERQRFGVSRHLYLARPLDGGGEAPEGFPAGVNPSPLGRVDLADVVRLFARAYAGRPEARCFAPDGRLEQWAHYVGQLLGTPAIGRYLPDASFVALAPGGSQPQAVVVTTAISPGTAHIAQVVVDPACRRSGLARSLLALAAAAARDAGHEQLTLLVSEANESARALYARLGFQETTHFLHASRPTLARRMTSPRPSSPALTARPSTRLA